MSYKVLGSLAAGGITLLVGYLVHSSKDEEEFEQVDEVTLSEEGYNFEHNHLKRLIRRLEEWDTVEITDAHGAPLTPEIVEDRFGPDGGVDCVIRIAAPTEHGAKVVRGRIREILKKQDY